jgi:hypothetical protein
MNSGTSSLEISWAKVTKWDAESLNRSFYR